MAARCMSDFRTHAEEILARHLAVLDEVQARSSGDPELLNFWG